MKIDWNKKYTTIAIYTFLVICASTIFFNLIKINDTSDIPVEDVVFYTAIQDCILSADEEKEAESKK